MQRRGFLNLGLASATLLALAGYGVSRAGPGLAEGQLTTHGRNVMRAVAQAQLDGVLPAATDDRRRALDGGLDRLDRLLSGLAPHAQAELSTLLGVMAHPAGRWALCALKTDWQEATLADVQSALQGMRRSGLALKVQAYQGLHDLVGAAHFSDPDAWKLMGYPGPRRV